MTHRLNKTWTATVDLRFSQLLEHLKPVRKYNRQNLLIGDKKRQPNEFILYTVSATLSNLTISKILSKNFPALYEI